MVDYVTFDLHSAAVGELLASGVEQYFEEICHEIPSFGELLVERLPQALENDSLSTCCITIPFGDDDLHEDISEDILMNLRLDLVNWVRKRKLKLTLKDNALSHGWTGPRESGYLGPEFEVFKEEAFLSCAGVQVPPGSIKRIVS